jgi:superfamily II DNA or RNA helicase
MTASLSLFDRRDVQAGYLMRPYQGEGVAAVRRVHEASRGALVVQATGLGKTVLFCEIGRLMGGCLVLVHRDSLARQAAQKLAVTTGQQVGVEKAERTAWMGTRYVVASVQTLKGPRLARFAERFKFPVIITDEAHRSVAPGYRKIYEAFPGAKLLGVTATPDRLDKVALGAVYDEVAQEYGILPATDDGWLTPVEYQPIAVDIDLGKIKKRGGDLAQDAMDDAVAEEAGKIARGILDHTRDKRLIVFTPGVKAAHVTAAALNRLSPAVAAAVDGTTDPRERERIERMHQAGELRYLVNCDTHTEGYDDPTLDGIMDCAKTLSRLKVMQRLGRATRLHSDSIGKLETAAARRAAIAVSPKPVALWFDLVCNAGRWDNVIIGPLDVLGGKMPDEVRARAKKKLEREGGTVDAAVRAATAEIEAERRAAVAAKMAGKARAVAGKARSIWDMAGIRPLPERMSPRQRPTPKMLNALRRRCIPFPENCTRGQAGRLIAEDLRREKTGLCRLAGAHWLARYGIDASGLTSAVAREIRDAIKDNGHCSIPATQLAAILQHQPGDDA